MGGATGVIEAIRGHEVVVEPFRGRDELWGLAVLSDSSYFFVPRREGWEGAVRELLAAPARLACFELRRLIDLPLPEDRVTWDVRDILGGDQTLLSAMRRQLPDSAEHVLLSKAEGMLEAHIRAARTAKMTGDIDTFVRREDLERWLKARCRAIYALDRKAAPAVGQQAPLLAEFRERFFYIQALREIESVGIHVDVGLAERSLREATDQADRGCLRSMLSEQRDGIARSRFNPMGGKTGRTRIEGGFNSMAVPREGFSRRCLTSRHPGGLIAAFDFNAIDYRCIVETVGGDFAELYRGAEDFHARTVELLFPEAAGRPRGKERRDAIKAISYVYIYGGSEETLAAKTGLSPEIVRSILERMDRVITPIAHLRAWIYRDFGKLGYVELPSGRRVVPEPDSHPGKVIGIFAQTHSSEVFERAVTDVHRMLRPTRSRIVMLVHDELVVDLAPEDVGLVDGIRATMEQRKFAVKARKGKSYGEAV